MKNILKTIIVATLFTTTATAALADDNQKDAIYNTVHNNSFRKDSDSARDQYRHPEALLRFSGVTASSTLLEINPGGEWFSRIMAPLVKDKGQYIGLEGNPARFSGNYAKNLKAFPEKMKANPDMYGANAIASWLETSPSAIKAGSVDVAFAIRTLHTFASSGYFETGIADIHTALKDGGHFIVVQHRANEDSTGDSSKTNELGRFKQSVLIAKIEAAGFKLVASDEMNANPQDPQDVSVWMLSPSLSDAEKNNGKYKNTGESDRMTLKFVKLRSK